MLCVEIARDRLTPLELVRNYMEMVEGMGEDHAREVGQSVISVIDALPEEEKELIMDQAQDYWHRG